MNQSVNRCSSTSMITQKTHCMVWFTFWGGEGFGGSDIGGEGGGVGIFTLYFCIVHTRMRTSEGLPPVSGLQDIRRKDRRTPMKVWVGKTFHFVGCPMFAVFASRVK